MNFRFAKAALRAARTLFIAVTLLPLAGCWDRTEINDLAIITATGIDIRNKKVELSVQVYVPRQSAGGQGGMGGDGGGGGASFPSIVRSAEGATIAEAMTRLQEKLPRKIFWGHDEVFVFGEQTAKEGIQHQVDFLLRHPQIRDRAYIVVSQGTAKRLLGLIPPLERSSAEVIREMVRSKIGIEVTVKDLDLRLSGDARAVALPWVKILSPESPAEKQKHAAIPYIAGTAVFRKDRMVGQVSDRTTRGVLWIRDEIESAVASVSPPQTNGFISMTLIRSETKLIPSIKGGHWKMKIQAKTEDDVLQNSTNLSVMDPDITKMLEAELGKQVENYMKEALSQVQHNMKADIFGFAEAFHQAYPKEWNQNKQRWNEIFPNVEIEFAIETHIRRTGEVGTPSAMPEEEVQKE